MRIKTRTLTLFAMLTAVALVLGYVERFIVLAPGIPGVKLGLGNTVLLYALYMQDRKSAALLMLLKVLLSGFLFGSSLWTILISLGGGIGSLCCMALLRCIPRISVVAVSIGGALSHMAGQLCVIWLGNMAPWAFLLTYMPVLGISAVLTGVLTGVIAKLALRHLKKT